MPFSTVDLVLQLRMQLGGFTSNSLTFILFSAAGGEIFDHCVGVKDNFDKTTSKRLIRQILQAVHFLHENEIVHLDLKVKTQVMTAIDF